MTEKKLQKLINKYDPRAELKKDNNREFRIFIYTGSKRYPISNAIAKETDWEIKRISEYNPVNETYPKYVISLRRLYLKKERRK